MPDGRVLIAFSDGPLVASPTWTRIDSTNSLVAEIEITAGKQSEFDITETNTATVRLNDRTGDFDPNNATGPYFGAMVGKQIMLQLYNPVTATWFTRFRGVIDKWVYDINPATRSGVSVVSNVEIDCVGVFDFLAGLEMIPGLHGDPTPSGHADTVFWEDGNVDDRIIAMLTGAGINSARYVVFSGNVLVIETLYDGGEAFLVGLRDAADAETPVALANIYEDRFGRFVFHGRQARLDPDTVAADAGSSAWDFQRFYIGDGAAITGDSNYAQIRPPFQYQVGRDRIVNAALVIPRKESNAVAFDRQTIPTLVQADSGSITAFGTHPYTYQDSINGGHKTNGDTASEDLVRSALFLIQNYSDPQIRLQSVNVKAIAPGDARAAKVWNVLSKADISDQAVVTVGYVGGDGIDDQYFIEGFTQTITPLNPAHDMVELSLNLSPAPAFDPYDDNPS